MCGKYAGKALWEQLLDMKLFPATDERPKTAFTFHVLRHFHAFNLSAKMAAFDFHSAMTQLTDSVEPHKVPVGTKWISLQ
jgi:hypothetical protein